MTFHSHSKLSQQPPSDAEPPNLTEQVSETDDDPLKQVKVSLYTNPLSVGKTVSQIILHTVPAGARYSYQLHETCDEEWFPLEDGLQAQVGDELFYLDVGKSYYIPAGEPHRLSNPGITSSQIMQVSYGEHSEEDIVIISEE